MAHSCCVLFGLALLVATPATSDVVNIGVNGSISGSGAVGYEFISGSSDTSSFTLAGTNTQLGSFSTSGQASYTYSPIGLTDSLVVQVDQDAYVSQSGGSTDIYVDVVDFENPGGDLGVGFGGASYWTSQVDNDISVSFTLTTESLVVPVGCPSPGFSNAVDLLDSTGQTVFAFTDCTATQFTLEPGTYRLQVTSESFVEEFVDSTGALHANSWDVDITSTVPEPHWIVLLPMLLLGVLIRLLPCTRDT